jgi:hypothetical protein
MNKYEKKMEQILTLHNMKQPVSAKEKEQELRQELIVDVANGDLDALAFTSKYKIKLNDDDDKKAEDKKEKAVKKDCAIVRFLKPMIKTGEDIFYISMSVSFIIMIIYIFLLWG